MSKEFSVLLLLLKAALWEKPPGAEISHLPPTGERWRDVFREARRQAVAALAYQGLCFLPERLLPPEELRMRWVVEAEITERTNRRMNRVLTDLYRMFRDNGLEPVLQKGQGVGLFYGNPLLRECGDIDLCFPAKKEWEEALRTVERQGIRTGRGADGSAWYTWKGACVEHHRRMHDMANPAARKFLDRHACPPDHIRLAPGADTEIAVPAAWQNLLLLNTHILKHAMGRGIGLRQLCDMARACYRLRGAVDGEWMRHVCHATGIAAWTRLLHAFLTGPLGMPADYLPYEETATSAQPLADIVERSGNFGQHAATATGTRQNSWRHKLETARAFAGQARFSYQYAPQEAFWTFTKLLTGQFKC